MSRHPNTANNSAIEGTKVNASPTCRVTKSDSPDPVFAGNNVTYTITVYNDGPSDATGVSLSDVVPAGTSFVSASNGGTNTAGTVTWSLGTIAANANKAVTLVVKVDPSRTTDISNTATATSGVSDPNTANNSAIEGTKVNTSADLTISKTGPSSAYYLDNVTYSITVNNLGPSDAQGVAVTDYLPAAGTTFVSASNGGIYDSGTNTMKWNLNTYTASQGSTTLTLTVNVTGSAPSSITNTAKVTTRHLIRPAQHEFVVHSRSTRGWFS